MDRAPNQVSNDFRTTKLVSKAFAVSDQRKACIGSKGNDRARAEGRLETKVDELVMAVDEYRASKVAP